VKDSRGVAYHVQVTGAAMLVAAYLEDVILTLQRMTVGRDEHGAWQVYVDAGAVPAYWSLITLFLVVGGILAFLIGFACKRRGKQERAERSKLTIRDLLISFGWVGLLFFGGLFSFYLGINQLLPEWFRDNPGVTALGGVSMQIAAMLVIPLYYRKRLPEIGLQGPVFSWKLTGYVLMFLTMVYALSLLTGSIGEWLGVNTDSYREQHISQELHDAMATGWLTFLLPLFATSVIAPFGEELLFRGVLQSTLQRKFGAVAGVLGSAFLFSLIHADLVLFLPIFLMGILFGWLYWLTRSLWAVIWLHLLNNLLASILDLL